MSLPSPSLDVSFLVDVHGDDETSTGDGSAWAGKTLIAMEERGQLYSLDVLLGAEGNTVEVAVLQTIQLYRITLRNLEGAYGKLRIMCMLVYAPSQSPSVWKRATQTGRWGRHCSQAGAHPPVQLVPLFDWASSKSALACELYRSSWSPWACLWMLLSSCSVHTSFS